MVGQQSGGQGIMVGQQWKQVREVMVGSSLETDQGSNGWTAVWKQVREVMVGQQSGNRSGK